MQTPCDDCDDSVTQPYEPSSVRTRAAFHHGVGDVIEEQYLVERRLKGGMSIVYVATDQFTGKRYALKVVDTDTIETAHLETLLGRFEREAAVWVNLDYHENIVQAFAFLKRREPMLVLEYIDGPSLKDVLVQSGALAVRQVVDWAMQFSAGMRYVHAKTLPTGESGILHRDIKPANILITTDGTLKITDFGLAKLNDQRVKSVSGAFLGTVGYASPEQLRNAKHVDRQSDVFSFGIVLYEMLTGRHPFPSEDLNSLAQSIQHRTPDWARVPSEFREVLQRCLNKSPRGRYADFEELAQAVATIKEADATSRTPDQVVCPACGFIGVRPPACVVCKTACERTESTPIAPDRPSSFRETGRMADSLAETIIAHCECGAVEDGDISFCRHCGRAYPRRQCPHCRAWNTESNTFCNQCGGRLQSEM